jgi:hypothetical protein
MSEVTGALSFLTWQDRLPLDTPLLLSPMGAPCRRRELWRNGSEARWCESGVLGVAAGSTSAIPKCGR